MPSLVNSLESLKVRNAEESNRYVNNTHSFHDDDLGLTINGCAGDESNNTVQIAVSTTPSYSNCAKANGQTSLSNYITDHSLEVGKLELFKAPKVCLRTLDFLRIPKELRQTKNLRNKYL